MQTSLRPSRHFANKTVVITGASSGVGKAAALAFASQGATLVLAARRAQALSDLAEACEALGAPVRTVVTDVTEASAMRQLAATAASFGQGHLDVWVNNAGVLAAGPFDEMPIEVSEQVIRTNLLGYMHGAHAALPYFKQQGFGVLINNISIGGFVAAPYAGAYSASKAGLQGFCASLRAELRPWQHIHVCDLFPAFLDTPGLGHSANYTGAELKLSKVLLFDSLTVAQAMVKVARHPRAATFPDVGGPLLKLGYRLFPETIGIIAEKIMRSYFRRQTPASPTSGNVLQPMASGTGIHGASGSSTSGATLRKRGLVVGGLLLAGLLALRQRSH